MQNSRATRRSNRRTWLSLAAALLAASAGFGPAAHAQQFTADFVKYSGRATTREFPMFLGTPAAIADQMEEWFGETCDGFVAAPNVIPGTYDDFARLVVPELQRRGLAQKEYRGSTLRENLGAGSSFGVFGGHRRSAG